MLLRQERHGCATAGFVLALIGLFIPFFVLQVLGLILSIVGIVRASKVEGAGRGLAIAGLVISLLGVIVAILTLMAILGTLGAIASSVNALAFMI